MSPGAANRNTGTVPKARSRNNNGVPQEIVNPTRRDRDMQVLADWASYPSPTNNNLSVSGSGTQGIKPQNRTPGEGTCYEIDNNRFIPVRPIIRRNVLSDEGEINQQPPHQNQPQQAVGVVLPSGPIFHENQYQFHRQSPLSLRIPDGSSAPSQVTKNQAASNRNRKNNIEERLNQIQEYIQLTTSLINSVQGEQSNGARPQSVQSIHTNSSSTPVQTPSIDDLKNKIDHQSRNMQSLKDQQNQLLRLHNAAKQQLQELEQIRNANFVSDFSNVETVEQAQNNVASLMTRMNAITSFIQNQNELCNLLGEDGDADVLAEQVALQAKLRELKNKKQQMEQLVNELQNMNDEASQSFAESDLTPTRIVPIDVERIVPIEMTNAPSRSRLKNKPVAPVVNNHVNGGATNGASSDTEDAVEADMNSSDQRVAEAATALSDKICEINNMKEQLKRLKDMMETVNLIEQKVGTSIDEEEGEEADSPEASRSPSVASQLSGIQRRGNQEIPEREKADTLSHMTATIQEQTRQMAIEKERLRNAQADIKRRSEALGRVGSTEASNRLPRPVIPPRPSSPGPKERQQQILKAELEAKRKELDKIEQLMGQRRRATEAYKVNPLSVATENSPPDPPTRARFTTPPQQVPQQSNVASKEQGDTRASDIYGTQSMEVPSSAASESTRSLHTVPPMPDIRTNWKRPVGEQSLGSSTNNDFPGVGSQQHSPWLPHFNGPPSSSNVGPQSPSFGYIGSDHLTYNPFTFCPPFNPSGGSNDPLVMQHFMQTQQMLMNSITQCNQLLWIQQREINNLNNAVLLLQERVLNSSASNLLHQQESIGLQSLRAESTPPNPPPSVSSTFNRARSEQPLNLHNLPYSLPPNLPPIYQNQQSTNFHAPNSSSATSQQIQRNNHAININNRNSRNVRSTTASNANANAIFENSTNSAYQSVEQANSFMNINNHIDSVGSNVDHEANLRHQNNVASANTSSFSSNLTYQNLLNNNQMYANQSTQQQTVPTLNNQVPPGVRANNYWDNFRSYSRQNLLSSNSCKSNEDAHHTHNSNNVERERIPQNMTRNINSNANNNMQPYPHHPLASASTTTTAAAAAASGASALHQQQHDNANVKYFNRNNSNNSTNANILNQLNSSAVGSGVGVAAIATISPLTATAAAISSANSSVLADMNQEVAVSGHIPHFNQYGYQSLNQSNSLDLGELQFHTNPINLGVNEFSSKSKTLPKGSGNKKYSIPLRNRDCNSLEGAVGGTESNILRPQDPKSTSKLFEALKENVYTEVTNLITANESRPHFLIQLFRELQLISSDPLRQRTIQSIQELYNRYVETSIIQEEMLETSPSRINNDSIRLLQQLESESVSSPGPLPLQNQQSSFSSLISAQSTPRAPRSAPDATCVNSIMNEIISAVHAVDYINDSILQKVTNIVFNHVSAESSNDSLSSRLMLNNDDFIRQLNHWNRTDKDEFITNLENYLNNILVECSNVAAANVSSTTTTTASAASFNSSTPVSVAVAVSNDLSINESTSSPNYNGFGIFMDGELAEADQVCSNDENMEDVGEGAVGMMASGSQQVYEAGNSEVLLESSWEANAAGNGIKQSDDYQNQNNSGNM